MIFRPRSVRWLLTSWYSAILFLILAAYSCGIYFLLQNYLVSEVDRQLRTDIETVEENLAENLKTQKLFFEHDDPNRLYFEVMNPSGGSVLANSESKAIAGSLEDCRSRVLFYETRQTPDDLHYRIGCKLVRSKSAEYILRTARSQERIHHELQEVLFYMCVASLAIVALCAVGGYWLAKKTLSPIALMTTQAQSISAERLSTRLEVKNPKDELGRLASTFNKTFERLEASFEQMKRFTADASHELRTPLTALRAVGEVSLREPKSAEQYREVIASMLEEADELRSLVESLLTLSRADSGQLVISKTRLDLSKLAEMVLSQLHVLAEEKNQTVIAINNEPAWVLADQGLLRQALTNLIDNAIKYSPEGSTITIAVNNVADAVRLTVHDNGPGIPEESLSKIFERFYRVDPSRTRDQHGVGIGLSISKWAVEANGGRLLVESKGGQGTTFTVILAPA